jgi:hypothetical protein
MNNFILTKTAQLYWGTVWPENCIIFRPIFEIVAQNGKILNQSSVWKPKNQHQTTFENLKYLHQTMFWNFI